MAGLIKYRLTRLKQLMNAEAEITESNGKLSASSLTQFAKANPWTYDTLGKSVDLKLPQP